jgi:hypothetical protein
MAQTLHQLRCARKAARAARRRLAFLAPCRRATHRAVRREHVSRTTTMDSALQAKYPELMSFKAFTTENSLNAARIDCDGINTRVMITYDKKVYYITSVVFNKLTYYACYAKDDSNFVKENFER